MYLSLVLTLIYEKSNGGALTSSASTTDLPVTKNIHHEALEQFHPTTFFALVAAAQICFIFSQEASVQHCTMPLETSLLEWFEVKSTVRFGTSIEVTLGKRREDKKTFPCAEVLYVSVSDGFSDEDVASYIRFHNAYVLHRVQKDWENTFSLVYDVHQISNAVSWPALLSRSLTFSLMHSSLGEYYKRWLYRASVIVSDTKNVTLIKQAQTPFIDKDTKTILFRTHEDKVTLAEELQKT